MLTTLCKTKTVLVWIHLAYGPICKQKLIRVAFFSSRLGLELSPLAYTCTRTRLMPLVKVDHCYYVTSV